MRVLIITDVTQPGGVLRHLELLVPHAQERGCNIYVLADDCEAISHSLARAPWQGIHLTRRPIYRGFVGEAAVRSVISAEVRGFRPDLVHFHSGSQRSGAAIREIVIENEIPLVTTEHYVGSDVAIDDCLRERIKEINRKTTARIAVCQHNQWLLEEHYGVRTPNPIVLNYGLPVSELSLRKKEHPLRMLFVGRLVARKGVDTLIKAIALLSSRERSSFRVDVLGDGAERPTLEKLSRGLGVSDEIAFHGWVGDVAAWVANAHGFVLPSLEEGQPLTLIDALCAGLPSVATAVSGVPEVMGNGEFGILVPPNDPIALAEGIRQLHRDYDQWSARAVVGAHSCRKRHHLASRMDDVLEVWRAAVRRARVSPRDLIGR